MRVGDTYGQLTVTGFPGPKKVTCRCSCGTTKDFWRSNLLGGKTSSCGGHRKRIGTGDTFGHWTVVSVERPKALCRCSCGLEKEVSIYSLLNGDSTSCGHARRTGPRERLRWMWRWMVSRTTNPGDPMYPYYGGRGVTVCPEWAENAEAYIEWALANGFVRSSGLQVDRIDNDGPYSPENCRVTTIKVNANNKRNNVRVSAWGENKTVGEWASDRRCQVSYGTLWARISAGTMAPEDAIASPPRHGGGPRAM